MNALSGAGGNQAVAEDSQVQASVLATNADRDLFAINDEPSVQSSAATTAAAPVDAIFRDAFREWIYAI
jgi:hypothetical protein